MQTLLLDKNYQPIDFISFRDVVRLVFKDKADVLSTWPNVFLWPGVSYPSVLRLRNYIRKRVIVPRFNRRAIFRRDRFECQYSGEVLPPSKLTVDHVVPRCKGGKSSWENCVTASLEMNSKKGNRTPEEASMKLMRKPFVPTNPLSLEYAVTIPSHPDWVDYFPKVVKISEK